MLIIKIIILNKYLHNLLKIIFYILIIFLIVSIFLFAKEVLSADNLLDITQSLGVNWSTMAYFGDTAIITRHRMLIDTIRFGWRRVGVTIELIDDNESILNVTVWCLHLDPTRYGPYSACDRRDINTMMTNEAKSAFDGPSKHLFLILL